MIQPSFDKYLPGIRSQLHKRDPGLLNQLVSVCCYQRMSQVASTEPSPDRYTFGAKTRWFTRSMGSGSIHNMLEASLSFHGAS